ncbi:hypothetical protein ACFX1T_014796 [Malus domestica]
MRWRCNFGGSGRLQRVVRQATVEQQQVQVLVNRGWLGGSGRKEMVGIWAGESGLPSALPSPAAARIKEQEMKTQ